MQKIKELSNRQLNLYLDAYRMELTSHPSNEEYKEKKSAIKQALEQREASGHDVPEKGKKKNLF